MSMPDAKRIRLFVTVEARMYREALLFELVHQKDIELVGESSKGSETLRLLDRCKPSTLVIEENLQDVDGLTVAEMALSRYPALAIVLLVDSAISQNRLAVYLDAGIKSVVSKKQSVEYLSTAINYTRNGQSYVDVKTCQPRDPAGTDQDRKLEGFDGSRFAALSEREQEVATSIADHVPLNLIAEQLGVSRKTVHTYKDRIFVKLGFQKMPELIVFIKRLNFYLGREEAGS